MRIHRWIVSSYVELNTDLSPGVAHEWMLNPHPNKPNYNLVCMRDSELPSFERATIIISTEPCELLFINSHFSTSAFYLESKFFVITLFIFTSLFLRVYFYFLLKYWSLSTVKTGDKYSKTKIIRRTNWIVSALLCAVLEWSCLHSTFAQNIVPWWQSSILCSALSLWHAICKPMNCRSMLYARPVSESVRRAPSTRRS